MNLSKKAYVASAEAKSQAMITSLFISLFYNLTINDSHTHADNICYVVDFQLFHQLRQSVDDVFAHGGID